MKTNREQLLLILTGSVIGLYILLKMVIDPALEYRNELYDQEGDLSVQVAEVDGLINAMPDLNDRWRDMRKDGGLNMDQVEAEAHVRRAISDWARQTGVQPEMVNPMPVDAEDKLPRLPFRVTLTGRMRSISAFLDQIEQAEFPIRVHGISISSRTEGKDELAVTLQMSTLFIPEKNSNVSRNTYVARR